MQIDARELDVFDLDLPIDAIVMGPIRSSNPLARLFPEQLDLLGCCYFHGSLVARDDCPIELLGALDGDGNPPVVELREREAALCDRRIAPAGPWEHSDQTGGKRTLLIPKTTAKWIVVIDPEKIEVRKATTWALEQLEARGASKVALLCPTNKGLDASQMRWAVEDLQRSGSSQLEWVVFCCKSPLPKVWRALAKSCP